MSDYADLSLDVADGVALVTLRRPHKLNAISTRLLLELIDVLDGTRDDDAVKALVLTGEGRAFSAGADLAQQGPPEPTPLADRVETRRTKHGAIGLWGVMQEGLLGYPKPLIAAVNGITAGGGLSVATMADMRIASSEARFICAFVRRALAPDTGISFTLPQLIGPSRAKQMLMTGDEVDAATALAWGLVNEVVDPGQEVPAAMALASRLAAGPSMAIELAKRLVNDGANDGFRQQMQSEAWAQNVAQSTEDMREGVAAFLEKRDPVWRGR